VVEYVVYVVVGYFFYDGLDFFVFVKGVEDWCDCFELEWVGVEEY